MADTEKTIDDLTAGTVAAGELPAWQAGGTVKLSFTAFLAGALAYTSAADWRTGIGVAPASALGVAGATSMALGGATIGTDALAWTGTASGSGQLNAGCINLTANTVPANGWYLSGANTVNLVTNSTSRIQVSTSGITFQMQTLAQTTNGWRLGSTDASATNPTLVPNCQAATTGFGAQAAGNISAVVGAVEVMRWNATGAQAIVSSTVAGLPTASTALKNTRTFVTDALSPVFAVAVTGGGSVDCPVYCDGSTWRCG